MCHRLNVITLQMPDIICHKNIHNSSLVVQVEKEIKGHLPNPVSPRNTHTHLLNGRFSGTTQVSQYQKGKTNLDFTEAGDSKCQWHQLGRMQVCTSLQTDNHASTPPLSFYRPDGLPKTDVVQEIPQYEHSVYTGVYNGTLIANRHFW